MLNIPTQSFPASSSQQRIAQSGQSGRNKVALKPGHSLMDWIRFSKSGKDLTGLRGCRIEVTEEELQKHNIRDDCWTCIRVLLNTSRNFYLSFLKHPIFILEAYFILFCTQKQNYSTKTKSYQGQNY
uniref:Uncharacterized protein n=1 Tax=Acanthochromis polyacanthus TaxID=80966 RepID=A0A3Q1FM07_9TELE